MKDHYFFFKDGMPLAVFLTEFQDEAMYLFSRLYKKTWAESVKTGITVAKEGDVPEKEWQRIHDEYKKADAVKRRQQEKKEQAEFKAQPKIVLTKQRPVEQGSTMLETAKYLR
jgi:hypothetical protein